jgi:hypothetical protein
MRSAPSRPLMAGCCQVNGAGASFTAGFRPRAKNRCNVSMSGAKIPLVRLSTGGFVRSGLISNFRTARHLEAGRSSLSTLSYPRFLSDVGFSRDPTSLLCTGAPDLCNCDHLLTQRLSGAPQMRGTFVTFRRMARSGEIFLSCAYVRIGYLLVCCLPSVVCAPQGHRSSPSSWAFWKTHPVITTATRTTAVCESSFAR